MNFTASIDISSLTNYKHITFSHELKNSSAQVEFETRPSSFQFVALQTGLPSQWEHAQVSLFIGLQ